MANNTEKKLKFYPTETFKEISLEGNDKLQLKYAISNFGRLVSYSDCIENGKIVKGTIHEGYRMWRYKVRDENFKIKHKYFFLSKLVATYFIPKTSEDQTYVLHLNYDRCNDYVENLKWATRAEMVVHNKKSPFVIEYRKKQLEEFRIKRLHQGNKLTSTEVMLIKKILLNPNRKTRLKILAKRFGVSEMTLHRIKTGENWGHIKV